MAEISNPTLESTELPFPDYASVEPVILDLRTRSLGGTDRRSRVYRKYKYVMKWDFIKRARYDALEAVVNTFGEKTFTYGKWPQSASGVEVLCELSDRELKYGVGFTEYLSGVTLTLTEVEAR